MLLLLKDVLKVWTKCWLYYNSHWNLLEIKRDLLLLSAAFQTHLLDYLLQRRILMVCSIIISNVFDKGNLVDKQVWVKFRGR